MNQMLMNFIQKQERDALKPDKPNPKVKSEDELSLSMIIETKPSSKKVAEYIKHRLNKIFSQPEES